MVRAIGGLIRLLGQQRFQARDHPPHDRLTRGCVVTAKVIERSLEKSERIDVAAIHLDDRKRGFRPQLLGVPVAAHHSDEPSRPFDGPLPLLDVVAVDRTAGQRHARERAKNDDLCRPTHPTCETIPRRHATRQDNRGFRQAIKSVNEP